MIGWDVREDGLAVIFSRDIPTFVRREMNVALERFLATNDIAKEDIDTFVSHPGGAKVIDALEEIFGMAPGDLVDARAVLRDFGNMSAATVLFVLRRTLDTNRAGGRTLLTTLGPGFTAGFLTLHA